MSAKKEIFLHVTTKSYYSKNCGWVRKQSVTSSVPTPLFPSHMLIVFRELFLLR